MGASRPVMLCSPGPQTYILTHADSCWHAAQHEPGSSGMAYSHGHRLHRPIQSCPTSRSHTTPFTEAYSKASHHSGQHKSVGGRCYRYAVMSPQLIICQVFSCTYRCATCYFHWACFVMPSDCPAQSLYTVKVHIQLHLLVLGWTCGISSSGPGHGITVNVHLLLFQAFM